MNVRLAPRALAEAKRLKTWWRENRTSAPDLFEEELALALERLRTRGASVGTPYAAELEAPVRRLLLPKTQNHVYFVIDGDDVVVVSVWGTPRGARPAL